MLLHTNFATKVTMKVAINVAMEWMMHDTDTSQYLQQKNFFPESIVATFLKKLLQFLMPTPKF